MQLYIFLETSFLVLLGYFSLIFIILPNIYFKVSKRILQKNT